jgi:hypothetical protein
MAASLPTRGDDDMLAVTSAVMAESSRTVDIANPTTDREFIPYL